MNLRRGWLVATLAVAALLTKATHAADPAKKPVVVELFTSEGCSSCPPADAWIAKLDKGQPLPDAQIIVLSEHVDYWDHDGWKDPYSSHALTERQSDYVNALRLSTAYTPQIMVDGTGELRLDEMKRAPQLFQNAATAEKVSVRLTSVTATPTGIRAHLEADGASLGHNAHVYLAAALDHAESQVLHGENGGRHLTHVAVVRELHDEGAIKKGEVYRRDLELKIEPGIDPHNLRVVAFVQESGPGKIVGADVWKQ